jgi:hypothetical protein
MFLGDVVGMISNRFIYTHFAALGLVLALSACTNGTSGKNATARGRSFTSNSVLEQPGSGTGENTLPVAFKAYVSARVAGAIDLVSENDLIGTNCLSSDPGAGPGSYLCGCHVTYTKQSGAVESLKVAASYAEMNLLRCQPVIPSEVQSVEVRLYDISSDSSSSAVLLSVNRGNLGLDYSLPEAFLPVRKFQCREHPNLPYRFDGSVYDPLQAADPALAYGVNFYTANFADSFYRHSQYNAAAGKVAWECPQTPYNAARPAVWEDQRVFSLAADPTAPTTVAKVIYDPAMGRDTARSSFHLARAPGGIFTVPVNAFIAPQVGGTLGFGAFPTPIAPGRESCPSVAPPAGYRWVKLWLYRGTFPARLALDNDSAIATVGAISCNPGLYSGTTDKWVFPDCRTSQGITGGSAPYSRILGTGMCVNLNPPALASNGLNFGYSQSTDVMFPVAGSAGQTPNFTCGGANAKDPFGICTPGNAPQKTSPFLVNLDQGSTRFDYVFVVTPPEVMSSEMVNTSSAAHNKYIPYRYLYKGVCNVDSTNPRDPDQSSSCLNANQNQQRINYDLTLHDMLTNGDPNKANEGGSFPVCAIQPEDVL